MRTTTWMLVALMGLFFVRPAPAEDAPAKPEAAAKKEAEKPKGPQFDEGAKKIFEAWERMIYHLGKEGVKKCSYTVTGSMEMMGQAMKGTGQYAWDGQKGSLKWDNPQFGAMIGRQGWNSKNMDGNFDESSMRKSLAGTKITLKSEEDKDILVVDGKTEMNVKAFVFNKEGVLTTWKLEMPDQTGGLQKFDFHMKWTKIDGKYHNTGWTFKVDTPMGAFEDTTTLTIEKIGGYHVLTKVVSKNTMGASTLDFTDWKFNDDVGKKDTEKKKETAGQ